jgi:hypothetical protein
MNLSILEQMTSFFGVNYKDCELKGDIGLQMVPHKTEFTPDI